MTDKQLAEQEARELAEQCDEQAKRLEQAMRAVNEVSKQHNRTAMTYGVCTKPSIGIWPESMQPCNDG